MRSYKIGMKKDAGSNKLKKTGIIEPSGCNWDAYDFRCSGVKDFDASKKMARQIVADAKVKYNLK
jgi:hypothetical protein